MPTRIIANRHNRVGLTGQNKHRLGFDRLKTIPGEGKGKTP